MEKIYQFALTSLLTGSVLAHSKEKHNEGNNHKRDAITIPIPQMKRDLPTRKENLEALQKKKYDILVVGGGVVGVGCALEAATRGLKVALVEANDFASGSSSRSTKLLHGGFRDFIKSLKSLDITGLVRVRNSLRERSILAQMAPHLSHPVPIMLPVHAWWLAPYYWFHLSLYNMIAPSGARKFYYIDHDEVLNAFPIMRKENLKGAYVFHENQHDDARMCLSIALTSARYGADICNYMKVVDLVKDKNNYYIEGAKVNDLLTGRQYVVRAKCVINATGAMVDSLRKLDDPNTESLVSPSMGTHVVLPGFYCPQDVGLFDPKSKDGRLIFFLPWLGHTIVGTTDVESNVYTQWPKPTEGEVQYLLEGIKNYVNPSFDVRRCDVLSVWSGFRSLPYNLENPHATEPLMKYIINVTNSNLITVTGGSWTSFRAMAAETIDNAIEHCSLTPERNFSVTEHCKLIGGAGWSPHMYIRLVQDFGVDRDVAEHLSTTYGTNAFKVVTKASSTGNKYPIVGKRLHSQFPYIEADVRQGVKEYACTLEDIIARRMRIAFLNVEVASEILPSVANIMAEEMHWSADVKEKQLNNARKFLASQMGQMSLANTSVSIPIKMSVNLVKKYAAHFKTLDDENTGYVSINKCCQAMQKFGVKEVPVDLMHNILRDIDVHSQGRVNLYEFLMLMSAIIHGDTAYLRYAKLHLDQNLAIINEQNRWTLPVSRSGGGL